MKALVSHQVLVIGQRLPKIGQRSRIDQTAGCEAGDQQERRRQARHQQQEQQTWRNRQPREAAALGLVRQGWCGEHSA